MTAEEKAALDWLETWAFGTLGDGPNVKHARTLKRLLARPVLPEEPSEEALKAIYGGVWRESGMGLGKQDTTAAYRALYAHLTAPPKPVAVWKVDCYEESSYHDNLSDALLRLNFHARKGRCVTIRQSTVPV